MVRGERGRAAPQRGERDNDFNITKICLKALAGGVLEWGFGATCRSVVEARFADFKVDPVSILSAGLLKFVS